MPNYILTARKISARVVLRNYVAPIPFLNPNEVVLKGEIIPGGGNSSGLKHVALKCCRLSVGAVRKTKRKYTCMNLSNYFI
jgi:hypothetical protein